MTQKDTGKRQHEVSKHDLATIKHRLDGLVPHLKKILPTKVDPGRFASIAYSAFRQNEKLLQCDETSVLVSIVEAATLNLELNSPLHHAWLVPYKSKKPPYLVCQLIIGYQGYVELIHRTGKLDTIRTACVYEKDYYEYEEGRIPIIKHKPTPEDDPGALIAAYVVTEYGGSINHKWLWKRDIEKARNSSQGKDSAYSPWSTHYDEMAKKTCVRQLSKLMPKSVIGESVARAVAMEEAYEFGGSHSDDVIDIVSGAVNDKRSSQTQISNQSQLDRMADTIGGTTDDRRPVESPRQAAPATQKAPQQQPATNDDGEVKVHPEVQDAFDRKLITQTELWEIAVLPIEQQLGKLGRVMEQERKE